ncbi:MAG: serine kinase [Boseongicola sp.]|nr:serine kinase [Boseongicola sp.]
MSGAPEGAETEVLHASAVAVGRRGLLILGASGSGKSTLAIQLIALGATLVADDRVVAARGAEGGLMLSAPETIRGRIEARGVGLMTLPHAPALAFAVVDLDRPETERLPAPRDVVVADVALPSIGKLESPAFPSILYLYLKWGSLER